MALKELVTEEVATTIISFEEQMRGWLAYIASKRHLAEQVHGYGRLLRQLHNYCRATILPFDEHAAIEYQKLRKLKPRNPTMDLKIAAVVLVNDSTIWTENESDFAGIPGLKISVWKKKSIP